MSINPNQAVFTSTQVIDKLLPILYVVHDENEDWQFLSGQEEGLDEEIRIVSFAEAIQLDKKVEEILWLPSGMEAYRKTVDAEWETRVNN
ncbi:MAG: hypothetical protein ACTHJ0_09110 [Flavipsychrobacter sp.]